MKPRACTVAVWAALLAMAAPARAEPAASCAAERAGDRVQIRVLLSELFDEELLHLVRLGLRGRIHLEVTLFRRRRFWFDQRRASEIRAAVVAWSHAQGRFTLDGRPVESPAALTLAPLTLRGPGGGHHYVEVNARLEVVTVESLGQMASWLVRGKERDASGPSRLGRSLVSYVAAELARTAGAYCDVR
jgi:hypothetical protein